MTRRCRILWSTCVCRYLLLRALYSSGLYIRPLSWINSPSCRVSQYLISAHLYLGLSYSPCSALCMRLSSRYSSNSFLQDTSEWRLVVFHWFIYNVAPDRKLPTYQSLSGHIFLVIPIRDFVWFYLFLTFAFLIIHIRSNMNNTAAGTPGIHFGCCFTYSRVTLAALSPSLYCYFSRHRVSGYYNACIPSSWIGDGSIM